MRDIPGFLTSSLTTEHSIGPDGVLRGSLELPQPVFDPFSKTHIRGVSVALENDWLSFEHPPVLKVLRRCRPPGTPSGLGLLIQTALEERMADAEWAISALRPYSVHGALFAEEARMLASVRISGRKTINLTNRGRAVVCEHLQEGARSYKLDERPLDLGSFRHPSDLMIHLDAVADEIMSLPDVEGSVISGGDAWLSDIGGELTPEDVQHRLRFLAAEEVGKYGRVEVWSADEHDGTFWMRIRWLDGVAWEGRVRQGEFATTADFVRAKMQPQPRRERVEPGREQLWGIRFQVADFGGLVACQPLDPDGQPFGQPRSLSREEFKQTMTRRGVDVFDAVKIIDTGSMIFAVPVDGEGKERGAPKSMPAGVLRSTYVFIEGEQADVVGEELDPSGEYLIGDDFGYDF